MKDYSLSQLPPVERFWRRVEKAESPYDCWGWKGDIAGGYGRMYFDTRTRLAHVISWFLDNGYWPEKGELVCHKCDNRLCTNPNHLYLGNMKTNIRDRCERNRSAVGERNGRAALSKEQVLEIRSKYTLEDNFEEVGKLYNVAGRSISNVLNRKTWNHI